MLNGPRAIAAHNNINSSQAAAVLGFKANEIGCRPKTVWSLVS